MRENCAAFRKLSLTCHPDRNSKDPKAPERFQLITKAKEFLSDEVRMILLADSPYWSSVNRGIGTSWYNRVYSWSVFFMKGNRTKLAAKKRKEADRDKYNKKR